MIKGLRYLLTDNFLSDIIYKIEIKYINSFVDTKKVINEMLIKKVNFL